MPRMVATPTNFFLPLSRPRSNATSARMPPSPSLSARITSSTYLTVTMMVTTQKTSEITPYTSAGVGSTALWSSEKTVCSE